MESVLHIPWWMSFKFEMEWCFVTNAIPKSGQTEFHWWAGQASWNSTSPITFCGWNSTPDLWNSIVRITTYVCRVYCRVAHSPCGKLCVYTGVEGEVAVRSRCLESGYATTRGPLAIHTSHLHSRRYPEVQNGSDIEGAKVKWTVHFFR